MPNFEENIFGLIPQREWLDVGFQVTRPNDPVDGLIDDVKTNNIVAYWQSIASEYQIPVMAQFHGYDTEANTTFRVPVDTHNIEKGLVKVKINQSERMRELIRSGVREDEMYDYVIRDGVRLAQQVVTRSKVAKNEMLATGKVTIKENNLNLTVDYGVPTDQLIYELDLSPDADIASQIQEIIDAATAKGVTINGMFTSKKNLTRMRQNSSLQKAINGNIGAGALIQNSALTAFLSTEFGIDRIVTNDLTYGADAKIDTNGRPSITTKRYFPQDKVTFFATNPGGRLGINAWGDPPEVDLPNFYPTTTSGESPYVYVTQKMEWDPAVLWTKASGLFIPVLYNPNSLFIATVKEEGTLGDLTVTSVAGTTSGTTKLTVSPAKSSGNSYKYKTGASATNVTYGQNVQTWTAWDGTSDITATSGQVITLVECSSDYKAKKSGTATVTAKA